MSPDARPQHEAADIHVRSVLWVVAGIVIMVLVVALVATALTRGFGPATEQIAAERPAHFIPLSSDPLHDIQAFEREKRSRLDSYGWVDGEHEFAHVPIERAMRALADQSQRQGSGRR